MYKIITEIIDKNRKGNGSGIYSICSANRFVLRASMMQAKKDDSFLLIEATSNQVDQFGGYTGMTPQQFKSYVDVVADETGFNSQNIFLGGDHLGPNVWQNEPINTAMRKAEDQIKAYVDAGFTKIHLDTSMPLEGDASPLAVELSAERAADLCSVAEKSADGVLPVYVIGTEVPIPGGATEELEDISPTKVEDVRQTLELTKTAFGKKGLADVWERVIAVVVQPGVEFSDDSVIDYSREKARELSAFVTSVPNMIYEAHSTDYQTPAALKEMVEDHFAILKVGPWLTYALREAVFALAKMEQEWLGYRKDIDLSGIVKIIDKEMLKNPEYWMKHYHGSNPQLAFARRYSYSDRIRYFWNNKNVYLSLELLIDNLRNNPLPISLISQYLPDQYEAIREGRFSNDPEQLIIHKIMQVLKFYSDAVKSRPEMKEELLMGVQAVGVQ
jgi:D-tagatose-1,6-bisphosphate aldolase subunit GatZ/KbaZ